MTILLLSRGGGGGGHESDGSSICGAVLPPVPLTSEIEAGGVHPGMQHDGSTEASIGEEIDRGNEEEDGGGEEDEEDVQPSTTSGMQAQNRQRRSKSSKLSQQELDAKFPGNVRARHVHESLQNALHAFRKAKEEGLLTVLDLDLGRAQTKAVGPSATALPDFPSLHAMREMMRPKIWLPIRCPAAAEASDPAVDLATRNEDSQRSRQEQRRSCTCPDGPTSSSSTAICSKGADSSAEGLAPCNLFGCVLSNPFCAHVEASVLDPSTRVTIPPGASFLMSEGVGTLGPLVACADRRKFDFIVADPPWENASVKRSKQYSMLPSRELFKLPVRQLIDPEAGLLALWVTNRDRIHRFIGEELLSAWGLRMHRTWYWVKMRRDGSLPTPSDFSNMHRHPYEHLLLLVPEQGGQSCRWEGASLAEEMAAAAARGGQQSPVQDRSKREGASLAETQATAGEGAASNEAERFGPWDWLPPDGFALFGAPGDHSRKPFLGELIGELRRSHYEAQRSHAKHADPDPDRWRMGPCLELFARELHPGWSSWGNEVLRFQASKAPSPAADEKHENEEQQLVKEQEEDEEQERDEGVNACTAAEQGRTSKSKKRRGKRNAKAAAANKKQAL